MRLLNVLPWALSVSSLLIPPHVADHVTIVDKVPGFARRDAIEIRCDGGCPAFLLKGTENGVPKVKTPHVKSYFVASVAVHSNRVLFNEQQIWPQTKVPAALTVYQMTEKDSLSIYGLYNERLPISTSMEYKPEEIYIDEDTFIKVHPITIEIMAVVDEVVHAQSVELRVVETQAGLGLLPYKIRPYQSSPLIDSCTTIWCRVQGTIAQKYNEWRAAAARKLKSWRGCGGKMRTHKAGGAMFKGGPNKFGPGSSLRPHRHHGHHHHRGRFVSFLHRVVRVMIPASLGLSIGFIIGSIIKALVLRVQRRRALANGEYTRVEQSEIEEARTSMDGLPKYEEVYGEIEAEKLDEKKDMQ